MDLLRRSLITALLFGIWSRFSGAAGLITWAGAAGCTTYFAAGGGREGAVKAAFSNASGIFWAILSIRLALKSVDSSLLMALTTCCMCMQGRFCRFTYTPGVFIGCFCVFAAGGMSFAFALSVFIGIGIGCISDCIGEMKKGIKKEGAVQ
ncbi:MAG: DUF1097 domain-containing protein [Clostridium sp.]|nr:DUF1097 domain-containing protein [Clostridium sp.]